MNLDWISKKAFDVAIKHFHKWYGLFCSFFLLWAVALIFFKLIPDGKIRFLHFAIILLVLSVGLLIYWSIYVWRYPKRSATQLGAAIAVHVEEPEDILYFQKDFVNPFKERISDLNLPFDVLVLKNHQADGVVTMDDARAVLKKTRAHFCIWGSVKKRKKAPDGNKYIFSLRGIVIHKPLYESQKVLLIREFEALLPHSVEFEETVQFENFQFRSNQVFTALDYITGKAALLSGDFKTAILLHEALLNTIHENQFSSISKDKLEKMLSLEYDLRAGIELLDPASRDAFKESVLTALRYDRNNYGALLKRAVIEFDFGSGDPQKALAFIDQARQHANGYHWLYSRAFLYFWLGGYEEAIKCCDKLKEKSYVGEDMTVSEVIVFNEDLLKKYFNKPQLYYWLGFVCYVKRGNLPLADTYFQNFIEKADSSMGDLIARAQSYLVDTKKKIGYSK